MTIDVSLVAGAPIPISVPATSVDVSVLPGDSYLNGWSFRDAQGVILANVNGSVTSPAANGVICTTPSLPLYEYDLMWTVSLEGTVSATDVNNFQVTAGATQIEASLNPGAVGVYPQPEANFMRSSAGTFSIKAIAAGTVGAVYSATLIAVPVASDLTVVQILDGARLIAEQSIAQGASETRDFGSVGLQVYTGITVHVVSGIVEGAVFARFAKGC